MIKKRNSQPKFVLGAVVNYNYVVGNAHGDVTGFSTTYDSKSGNEIFNATSLGMQQGGGLTFIGKYAINRKRNLYFTGELGYNLFYNTGDGGRNRTRWNIFNLAPGIELNHKSTPRNKVFAGMQIQYSLIIGNWQSDVIYPDNFKSNVYYKFNPASRLGLSLSTGMEFKVGKKSNITIGLKGAWVNILPKSNSSSGNLYRVSINDADNSNGIDLDNTKEIIYIQLFTGINFRIK